MLLHVVAWHVLKIEALHCLTQRSSVATAKSLKTHSLAPATSSYAYLVVLAVVILMEKVTQVRCLHFSFSGKVWIVVVLSALAENLVTVFADHV